MSKQTAMQRAGATFISCCWEKFSNYYAPIGSKKIVIYGSGVYGKFLYKALSHIGYKSQICYFVNDFSIETEKLFDIPIVKFDDLSIDKNDYIFVVGIQNSKKIVDKMNHYECDYIVADYDQCFYQDNLMYTFYKCITSSPIANATERIYRYYCDELDEEYKNIKKFFNDSISHAIIDSRVNFYNTGDCRYLDTCPHNEKQYFDSEYYNITNDEVFIDCGAFNGDSIQNFLDYTKGNYKKIHAFEPDKISSNKMKENLMSYDKICYYPFATGSENRIARFESKGVLGSGFSNDGEGDVITIRKIDDVLQENDVSLIKMDIEGAELDSLKGAEKIIKQFKPKLAICIYHKMEDLFRIPQYIRDIVPEYRFKIRQHSATILETVLYAECESL